MAAVLVFTSDSKLILWELASCRNTCILTFMLSLKGESMKKELCFYIINYPDFPWELLHRLLHSSKLPIHPFSHFFQGVSHLFTETESSQMLLTQKHPLPWRCDVMFETMRVCFVSYSPPWCTSSRPEGDWPSTLAPSAAAAGLSPSAAQHRTLWAHGAAARSLAPHWSGLGGAARETGSHRSGFRPLRQTFTNTELHSLAGVYTSSRVRLDTHPNMHVDWMRRFLHRVSETGGW